MALALALPAAAAAQDPALTDDFSAADQYVESVPTSHGPKVPGVGKHKKNAQLPAGVKNQLQGEPRDSRQAGADRDVAGLRCAGRAGRAGAALRLEEASARSGCDRQRGAGRAGHVALAPDQFAVDHRTRGGDRDLSPPPAQEVCRLSRLRPGPRARPRGTTPPSGVPGARCSRRCSHLRAGMF